MVFDQVCIGSRESRSATFLVAHHDDRRPPVELAELAQFRERVSALQMHIEQDRVVPERVFHTSDRILQRTGGLHIEIRSYLHELVPHEL